MITSMRLRSRVTALVVSLGVAGGLALAAAPMADAAITPPSPDICDLGYVWRQAVPTDHVCVTPATRSQTWADNAAAASRVDPTGPYGPNTCIQGYVWREAVPGDFVCVTPDVRAQAAADNAQAASRAIGNGITMSWPNLTFDNGVALGGWATLTVYGNGQYEFSGDYHDSGLLPYTVNTVVAFRAGDGTVFTFTDSGTANGHYQTIFGGSNDHSWDVTGTNPQIQADWANVQQLGSTAQLQNSASLNIGTIFNDIMTVIGYVKTVVSVVGAIL